MTPLLTVGHLIIVVLSDSSNKIKGSTSTRRDSENHSLIPRPTLFLLFGLRKWKSGKWGRPGSIYHMSDIKWT